MPSIIRVVVRVAFSQQATLVNKHEPDLVQEPVQKGFN